jgi:hypothetical protein
LKSDICETQMMSPKSNTSAFQNQSGNPANYPSILLERPNSIFKDKKVLSPLVFLTNLRIKAEPTSREYDVNMLEKKKTFETFGGNSTKDTHRKVSLKNNPFDQTISNSFKLKSKQPEMSKTKEEAVQVPFGKIEIANLINTSLQPSEMSPSSLQPMFQNETSKEHLKHIMSLN